MPEQYDMLAHMKRAMRNMVDSFEQGNTTKDDLLDSLSVFALEYHNVILRRLVDEFSGTQQQPVEPTDGKE